MYTDRTEPEPTDMQASFRIKIKPTVDLGKEYKYIVDTKISTWIVRNLPDTNAL